MTETGEPGHLEQVSDGELQSVHKELEERYVRNLAVWEAVLPEAANMLQQHEPTIVHLAYDPAGFVNLVNSHNGQPVYPGNPLIQARQQVAQYREAPEHLSGSNHRTIICEEANNAHIHHSNQIVDLLLEHPQERMTGLPDHVSFMLMLGVGLGYHIEALMESSDIRHLCLVEPELDIFKASLHTIDWLPVVEHFSQPGYSLELVLGRSPTGSCREIHSYLSDIGSFHAVAPFIYSHLQSPKLSLALKDFRERIMPLQFVAQGYFDDEQIGLAHSLENHRQGKPLLQDHVRRNGEYLDRPAFIVANGPSLDRSVEWIRQHQDRAVIFSCGTALGSLIRAGIKPDFQVEAERLRPQVEWIEEAASEDERQGLTLLALNTVHPDAFDLFEQGGVAMKSNDAGTRFLSRYFSRDSEVVVLNECNPTVTNSAVSLASALGFSEVYLFGLDLGFPAGDQHHSALSVHYRIREEEREALNLLAPGSENQPRARGNFGGEVQTTELYLRSKWVIESAIRANPGMRCFNASEGLLIEGARPVRPSSIHLDNRAFNKKSFVDRLFHRYFTGEGLLPVNDADLTRLREQVLEILPTLGKLAEVPVASRKEALAALGELNGFMREKAEDEGSTHAAALLEGSVAFFSVLLAQALHRHQDEDRCLTLYRSCLKPFRGFLESAEGLASSRLFALDAGTWNLSERVA